MTNTTSSPLSTLPLTSRVRVDGTRTHEHVDFGVADKRGRAIGALVETETVTFVPAPVGATSGWHRAPGTFFRLCVQATRNGKEYGASQPDHYFATEAERVAAITKMLAGSRRRAAKVAS
jgi:hypothetical protein